MRQTRLTWPFALPLVGMAAGCATPSHRQFAPIALGARYVAMGSSFAAGLGVTVSADQPTNRCARSNDNFAHIIARRLDLQLTDVSCSGATTAHVLGSWNELPPQVQALTPDTKLVTVTIGGNDVGYFGMLWSASCVTAARSVTAFKCPIPSPSSDPWRSLDAGMRGIAAEVHRRSPAARLVFVDYLSVLPDRGQCTAAPMNGTQADAIRATAAQLASLTARVAAETGSEIVKASVLSQSHAVCSADPWITGFSAARTKGFIPYHPNARGMLAIANALEAHLAKVRK